MRAIVTAMTNEEKADLDKRSAELAKTLADPEARERFRREGRAEALRRMPHMTEAAVDAQWEFVLQLFR